MVECCVTLDRADNKDNANNVRLITFPFDNDECQTLEELEVQKNSHLVNSEQRRRTAVYCARGNSNARTVHVLTFSSARAIIC